MSSNKIFVVNVIGSPEVLTAYNYNGREGQLYREKSRISVDNDYGNGSSES